METLLDSEGPRILARSLSCKRNSSAGPPHRPTNESGASIIHQGQQRPNERHLCTKHTNPAYTMGFGKMPRLRDCCSATQYVYDVPLMFTLAEDEERCERGKVLAENNILSRSLIETNEDQFFFPTDSHPHNDAAKP